MKTKEELQDELEDLKAKREEEEELAKLKSDIREEKNKISNAKYGSFINIIKKVGKVLADAGDRGWRLSQPSFPENSTPQSA